MSNSLDVGNVLMQKTQIFFSFAKDSGVAKMLKSLSGNGINDL